MVHSPAQAELVIWSTVMSRIEAELVPVGCSNVVVLDYADGCTTHKRRKHLQHEVGYFKRSRVKRVGGVFASHCGNWDKGNHVRQWAYSGSRTMLRAPAPHRDLAVLCALRSQGNSNSARKRVVGWTSDVVHDKQVSHKMHGNFGTGGPGVLWQQPQYDVYFNELRRAKIVVTCNPATWEGDFRLWESLLSLSLIHI
eukprot:TRINITY_DN7479_c0_g2_i1.p1 TRINITY_DN7479_c0_g2~~TRINITY_DN7479_c0_g2_i1.p1  ORF type:complete len:197 (-),score=42.08 TRINITY_DN7479_c0_g2_i1:53-643(-)